MSVIDDILGIKKEERIPAPVVNDQAIPTAGSESIQQSTAPVDFRSAYNSNGNFYDALSKTFGPREVIDEKAVKSRKNLAGLADFATNLNDIISGSIGGNVVARNASASSDFDNKLMGYRRQLDDKNRQYDMMAYRAKMMDIQERMRRGERLEDIAHRDKREGIQDVRYKEEKDWRKEMADKKDGQWERSFERQGDQLDHRKKIDYASLGLQRDRLRSQTLADQARMALKYADSGKTVGLFVGDKRFDVPKNDWEGLALRAQDMMAKENPAMFSSDMQSLAASINEPNARKAQALVMTKLSDYPNTAKFVESYLGKGVDVIQREESNSNNPLINPYLQSKDTYNGPIRNTTELTGSYTSSSLSNADDPYAQYARKAKDSNRTIEDSNQTIEESTEDNASSSLGKQRPSNEYEAMIYDEELRSSKEKENDERKTQEAKDHLDLRLQNTRSKIDELSSKLVPEIDVESFIDKKGIDPSSALARKIRLKAADNRKDNALIEREIERLQVGINRLNQPDK